jgi:hypothetical protein
MPHTCRTAILLATCILGLGCQSANLTDAPSPENFLRRTRAAATVLGNHVYIEGGELSHMVNGSMEDVVRGTGWEPFQYLFHTYFMFDHA